MIPTVTSPLLLIAGLIKHSKLCPPTLMRVHFWVAQTTQFKRKQKVSFHSLLDLAHLPCFSEYLGPESDGRTVLIQSSVIHSSYTADRSQRAELGSTLSCESFHRPMRLLGLCQFSWRQTEAHVRKETSDLPRVPQLEETEPRSITAMVRPDPCHPGLDGHSPASSWWPGSSPQTYQPHLVR